MHALSGKLRGLLVRGYFRFYILCIIIVFFIPIILCGGMISMYNLIIFSMSKVMMQLTLLVIIHRSISDLHWIHLQMIIQNISMDCSTSMDLKILYMVFENQISLLNYELTWIYSCLLLHSMSPKYSWYNVISSHLLNLSWVRQTKIKWIYSNYIFSN